MRGIKLGSSGSSGGDISLDNLSDVNITSPVDNQVLTYDSTNSEWVNDNINVSAVDVSMQDGNTVQSELSVAYANRLSSKSKLHQNTTYTITFSGKAATRKVVAILFLCGQSSLKGMVCIAFKGNGNYENIGDVMISDTMSGILSVSGKTITVQAHDGGWGKDTLIYLNPDDTKELTTSGF